VGAKTKGVFTCASCGLQIAERENTARNVLKRGREAQKKGGDLAEIWTGEPKKKFIMKDFTDKCGLCRHFTKTGNRE